jgi:membrane fusion protein, multidrug efflux system
MAQAEVVEQQESPPRQPRAEERPGQPAARQAEVGGPAPAAPAAGAEAAPAPRRPMPRRTRLLLLIGLAVVVIAALAYWLHSRQFEDTDDAQVDGDIHPISARVNGTVLEVNPKVQENQLVAAGTLMALIDPADFQADLDRAQAEVDRLRATAAASGADVPVQSANALGQLRVTQAALAQARQAVDTEIANAAAARARVAQAQAGYTRAEADRERYAKLLDKQEISRSEFDQKTADARTTEAALDAAKSDVVAAEARVAQARANVAQQEANVTKANTAPQQIAESKARFGSASADLARAEAQLATAKLNLSYTRIVAPVGGIIGRKNVEVGQRVQPGQELVTIVELDNVWITADFKETQLRRMHPGQTAEVHVDAYGIDLPGHVESIAAATGARFSLLPPENASGNFVKVVQRLPVRIRLDHGQDPDHRLVPGMSVDVTVRVR